MLLFAAAGLLGPSRGMAQLSGSGACGAAVSDPLPASDDSWSFGIWFAGGTHEPLKTVQGHKEDRALYLVGIEGRQALYRSRYLNVDYTPALVPGVLATANRDYNLVTNSDGRTGVVVGKKNAFGAGLLPIAIEMRVFVLPRASIVIGGGGGAAYFDRRIPDPDETRFNFLADGHAGLSFHTGMGVATAGFWLQHISNANTGKVNPGMDSRMLYVAFSP